MDITVIRNEITVGQPGSEEVLTVFVGFIKADDLNNISTVPAIAKKETYFNIANEIDRGTVHKWQRPYKSSKIEDIKEMYNNQTSPQTNFMVNPVILTENFELTEKDSGHFKIRSLHLNDHIFKIDINVRNKDQKPIWIIDGQHRVKGIGESEQRHNEIPFVLILDFDKYSGQNNTHDEISNKHNIDQDFAGKLFAEVNTKNWAIDDVHKMWLAYYFEFNTDVVNRSCNFHPSHPKQAIWKNAFETVVRLTVTKNPFKNQINFNDYTTIYRPSPANSHHNKSPFGFKNYELCFLFVEYYEKAVITLSPSDLKDQFLLYYHALDNVLKAHSTGKNVFFGRTNDYGLIIFQRPFIRAFLSQIALKGKLFSTVKQIEKFLINQLSFDKGNWEFYPVLKRPNKDDELLVQSVFSYVFDKGALPTSLGSPILIPDYLKGKFNTGEVDLFLFQVLKSGKLSRTRLLNGSSGRIKIIAPKGYRKMILDNKHNTKGFDFNVVTVNSIAISDKIAHTLSSGKTIFKYELDSLLKDHSIKPRDAFEFDVSIKNIVFQLHFNHIGQVKQIIEVEIGF